IAMSGQIVDASLVAAPRQRNTDDEKKAIKEGRIPANWKAKPAKLRHKDRDARWTVIAEQKDRMSLFIRTIGIARATTKIGMANLVYNIKRFIFLRKIAIA